MRYLFVLILMLGCQLSFAQKTMRLTEGWEFLQEDLGGIWEAVRPAKKGDPETVPLWKSVTLPHSANEYDAVDPDVNYYEGPMWYKTALDINNPYTDGRTLLHFEGAGQKSEVYIYTTKVGRHVGGYDEWTVDITDAVKAFKDNDSLFKAFKGKIPVEVRCDNSRDLEMIPSDLSDFNLYGGLYRYVNLVYEPALYIDKVFASPHLAANDATGKVGVKLRFDNPKNITSAELSVRLRDPAGNVVQNVHKQLDNFDGDQTVADLEISQPKLWAPDAPLLYSLETTISSEAGKHTTISPVGFRSFEFVKKGPFKLNGKRLLLRGTHRHEDHAGLGPAMTEELMRKEMILMKDMGVNFIRLAHYQQSPIILHLCDSLGIIVWEEIPWCRGGLGGEIYQAQGKRMLTNMIEQHYNHPAVVIWGLGNENDWPNDFPVYDKEKIKDYFRTLNSLAHRLDPSRKTAIRRCDFAKDIVDVYSPSIWAGWYRGIYTEYKEVTQSEFSKVDHFLHVEWGGDSHARRHSENPDNALKDIKATGAADERAGDASLYGGAARASKDGDWSETYICNLFDWHLKEQETMPWLTGTAQWVFKDFSTPVRPDNPIPYMNQKGVVERDLTKKEAYYVFQSYWTSKPMAHIYGHSWPVRWGREGEEKMIKVYSNCDEAELFVNGKSYGIRKRNSQNFPAAGLRWNVPMHKGDYKAVVLARTRNKTVRDSVQFTYQTEKWGKPALVTLEKVNEVNGVTTIEAKLYDANHVACLDATNWINFGLTGDGKLIDDLGTSSGSRKVQLYNGRAIIRLKTNGGSSVASAKVDNLPVAFLTLTSN